MPIVIAGGTGRVGSGVTHQLLDRGERVRVLTRDVDLAAARLGREAALELVSIDYGNPVVESDSANAILRTHRAIEKHLGTAAIEHTVIRPATFIDAIAAIAAGFIPTDAWGGNTAGGRAAFVDIRDVAELAAAVLTDGPDVHAGRKYVVSGPEALSMEQVAGLFSAALGHVIQFHQRGEEESRAFLSEFGLPEARVNVLLALDQLTRENFYATVSPDTETLLGRAARPDTLFISENAPSLLPNLA
jgi:uncharacterized protein YbjT (DUF2867 family)